MQLLASILHLSDLHLGQNFTVTPTPAGWRQFLLTAVNLTRMGLRSWPHGAPHSTTILRRLATGIDGALLHLQQRFNDPNLEFDAVVVSGDLLTAAYSTACFDQFAYPLLTGSFIVNKNVDIGLKIPEERLFVLPGNHDRYDSQGVTKYLASDFVQRTPHHVGLALPKRTTMPLNLQHYRQPPNSNVYVFTLDSNDHKATNWNKGIVEPELVLEIVEQCRQIRAANAKAVIVLALHHPPYDLSAKLHGFVTSFGGAAAVPWVDMELEHWQPFRTLVGPAVDLVLFGHLHWFEAWQDDDGYPQAAPTNRGAVYAQAPTACQLGNDVCGFNVYTVVHDAARNVHVEAWPYTYQDATGFERGGCYWPLGRKHP